MIVVGKLVDGTEIVGEAISETDDVIEIANPLQIIYKYTMNSIMPAVSFARFMMFADQQQFDFLKDDFMIITEAAPEMTGVYRRLLAHMNPADHPGDPTDKAEVYKALLQSLEPKEMTEH